MATSSLFHSFEFSGEAAGRFAKAVEESWRECEEAKKHPKPPIVQYELVEGEKAFKTLERALANAKLDKHKGVRGAQHKGVSGKA